MPLPQNLLTLAAFALSLPPCAAAATLCVTVDGGGGCYSHIAEAVAAAHTGDVINVGPGTFREGVVITKSLSLTGNGTTLDATGLSRGFFVNGISTSLANVNISGFMIENANFEGVLIANASAVTVSNSTVLDNNRALSNGTCPGLEKFEPIEQSDCGEGIHLLGADHSIVTNNTVRGNSGGILISDDTGPTHDNLISYNMVSNNAYACGIVLASHPPATDSGSSVPLGVFHNTVFANRSKANGLANGGGAGIGIFASVPLAKTYGNVVVGNLVADNGLPGIAMHAHVPNQILTDNMVVGNTVVNNGRDTQDAATPGSTGINLYSAAPATGNIISGNSIQNESYDVVANLPVPVQVQFNALLGLQWGLDNLGTGSVNATQNWWSCTNGPTLAGSCSFALGSEVQVFPWLQMPIPAQPNF